MKETRPTTFAAALTAPAPGAIAVVAVAGSSATAIVQRIIKQPKSEAVPDLAPDRPRLIRICDGDGHTLDDAILVVTTRHGHDYIELQPHGGVRIVERILQLVAGYGATVMDPTAFAARFLTTHRLERELNAALLQSTSRRLTQWLLAQTRQLPDYLAHWIERSPTEQADYIERTQLAIRLLRGLRIALVGPPNVGKSTLANRLIGHDRAITSDTAGTTRDWIDETINIAGWPFILIDTAGVRLTDDVLEATAIERGRAQMQAADLILLLEDATATNNPAAENSMPLLSKIGKPIPSMRVANKIDQLPPLAMAKRRSADISGTMFISAASGTGIDALQEAIIDTLSIDQLQDTIPTGFHPAHLPPFDEAT